MVRSEGHSGRDAIAVSIIWQQKLPMLVPISHDRSRKPASVKCIPITTSMAISRTQKGRSSEMCLNMPIQGPLIRMPVLAKGMEAKVKLRLKRIRAALSRDVKRPVPEQFVSEEKKKNLPGSRLQSRAGNVSSWIHPVRIHVGMARACGTLKGRRLSGWKG